MNEQKTGRENSAKRLMAGIIILILLTLGLCITTAALVIATLKVENNLFTTGEVRINLNDGKTIVEEMELTYEPGATVERQFFIENTSSCDVYYKIYFDNLDGALTNVLKITINDGDTVIYSGTAAELKKESVAAAPDALRIGERKNLTISFYFPPESGNDLQQAVMTFDVGADAVQTKNNPNRLFN